jgi:aromatic-amino-acid transaminase
VSHLIPERQGRPGNDPIFALSKLAEAHKKRDDKVLNATLGVMLDDDGKLALLASCGRAQRELSDETIAAYAPITGAEPFLGGVKKQIFDGAALGERAVSVATPGGTGAIRHAITSFLPVGGSLLTTSFYWGPYSTIADEHGRKVKTFRMFDAHGALDGAALDEALGARIAEDGRALLMFNDPCHNPTGYSMSDADWDTVSTVLRAHASKAPVSVVLDSAYAAFSEGSLARPLRALEGVSDKILLAFCWSASKTFLQYGLRVGALVVVPPNPADAPAIEASLAYSCRGTWSNCNAGGMAAITKLLVDPAFAEPVAAERRVVTKLLDARVAAWNETARAEGLVHPRYDGGFFVTVPTQNHEKKAEILRERGVYLVPLGAGALRVALCSVPTAEVPRLARTVAEVVRAS